MSFDKNNYLKCNRQVVYVSFKPYTNLFGIDMVLHTSKIYAILRHNAKIISTFDVIKFNRRKCSRFWRTINHQYLRQDNALQY